MYLDYTGGGLHAASQVDAHAALLRARVLGNPHSDNPTSLASSELVESTRQVVCDFFRAPREEYLCVFTANASAALRLVGESYPFARGGTVRAHFDNHNSVNGIREFARRNGAQLCYVPVTAPELRVDRAAMSRRAARGADPGPATCWRSRLSRTSPGCSTTLDLVGEAHEAGWDVLVDAAAYAPTSPFDVGRIAPDFAAFSFYKIIGLPDRRRLPAHAAGSRGALLSRPWFSGGTVTIASVRGDGHYLHPGEAAFEDGTVDYLNLPAVADGLRHIQRVGLAAIHRRVHCLTAWLLDALTGLRHANGRPLVQILGPVTTGARRDRDVPDARPRREHDRRSPRRGAGGPGEHLAAHRVLLQPRRRRGRARPQRLPDAPVVRPR